MSFRFVCPFCDQTFECDDELSGKVLKCSNCGNEIVPEPEEAPKPPTMPEVKKETPPPEKPKKKEEPKPPVEKKKLEPKMLNPQDVSYEDRVFSTVDATCTVILVLNFIALGIPILWGIFTRSEGAVPIVFVAGISLVFVWFALYILKHFFGLLCRISTNTSILAEYIAEQKKEKK